VIRALSERVEKEHAQHLRDAQRIEDRSSLTNSNSALNLGSDNPSSDFAKLVGAGLTQSSPSADEVASTPNESSLDDDIWGSILNDQVCCSVQYLIVSVC
jgi:SCY1-like protein 2